MNGIYEWVRNIAFYMIFVTVLSHILPNKKYDKYLHLFTGMLLILLVVKPLTGGLHLEEQIAGYFESITFQNEAADLQKELLGVEGKRLERLIGQYEEAVAIDVAEMARAEGLSVVSAAVRIGKNPEDTDFGMVQAIYLTVSLDRSREDAGSLFGDTAQVKPVEKVQTVVIGSEKENKSEEEPGDQEAAAEGVHGQERLYRQEENAAVLGLRDRLTAYYKLEEGYVEIQVENGKGDMDASAGSRSDLSDSGSSGR